VLATGRNQWQIGPAPKPQEQAKTVAAGCDQLPFGFHGKEGVDGSTFANVRWVWSRLWSTAAWKTAIGA
jgi:hypothetical protein